MKYLFIIVAIVVLLTMPQVSLAGCQTITIMQDGTFKTCTVCTMGSSTTVTCF